MARRAVEAGAHAVAIAGDVFDGTGPYFETRQQFLAGLEVLDRAGIPVVAVAGNHDHEALPRFARQHPLPGFHLLGVGGIWEWKQIETSGGKIAFVGWSFPQERVPQNQFGSLEIEKSRIPTVGLVHGDIAARSPYHPVEPSDFAHRGDAWVIGHVHLAKQVTPRAHYPGSPQALDFGPGERGVHGFKWLEISGRKPTFSEVEPISTVRFEEAEIEIGCDEGEEPWVAANRSAEERILQIRQAQPGLRSVQLRAQALFLSGTGRKIAEGIEVCQDGSGAFLFTDSRIRSALDKWRVVEGPTAIGEAARLLLGLEALTATDPDPRVKPEWCKRAEELIERSVEDVKTQHKRTLLRVSDEGDSGRREPSDEDARRVAIDAAKAELETMLIELEAAS
jgi:DNA repair exonuclease SbcCD nuclease subunit